jgi:hypothetical protein
MNPLSPSDRDKLAKLMQLAQSPRDHEALSALRKANALLHRNNLDWQRMLNAIDDRKIIAWENEQGGTTFRPSAWAFDQDLNEEEAKRRLAMRERAQLGDVIVTPPPSAGVGAEKSAPTPLKEAATAGKPTGAILDEQTPIESQPDVKKST